MYKWSLFYVLLKLPFFYQIALVYSLNKAFYMQNKCTSALQHKFLFRDNNY